MGIRALRDTAAINTTPSNLKLALQRITKFSGKVGKWQKRKTLTTCAFIESGYEAVLNNWYEA
eukprot:10691385-Ditylum_brightwellii.AAC.1